MFNLSDSLQETELRPRDVPHLLEWYSWHCVGVADASQNAQVKTLLRLLAADLAIEALTVRRQWKDYDLAELVGHEGRWRLGATIVTCGSVSKRD